MECRHSIKSEGNKITWEVGMHRELGRLSNGHKSIKGNQTIKCIAHRDIRRKNRVTYIKIVCDYKPQKLDPHRVCLCVGGE